MNTYKLIGLAGFATAILFFFAVETVYADTIVSETLITTDVTWGKTGNPYLLDGDVRVVDGATLTITEGVKVIGRYPEDIEPEFRPGIYVSGGHVVIKGRGLAEDRVGIDDVRLIAVENGSAFIANADIRGGSGLSFEQSRAIIATSTIRETFQAIRSKKSDIQVIGSRIEHNTNGVRVESDEIFQVKIGLTAGVGGIGNALESQESIVPSFIIQNSTITDNESMGGINLSDQVLQAPSNWWGSAAGPKRTGANRIGGDVEYEPWLTDEPVLDAGIAEPIPSCCSSILFIPGFQGTRLHERDGGLMGMDDTLWEPMNDGDVRDLFLDEFGSTTNQAVYAGGPLRWAYGIKDIYAYFLDFLDRLVEEDVVGEWSVFGYDWRKPVAEVVAGREKRAATTESLIETVEELASRSKTGKVTLIAHSNGGLVAKYLVKTLASMNKESLIDGVISVAVPYLGTPTAILALLHGDGQALAGGILLSGSVAREWGKNMPSVYSLLPSREYFAQVFTPTIAFASTTVTGINTGSYPREIISYEGQDSFIADAENNREAPAIGDLSGAIKGNEFLMAAADVLHGIIDPFTWPASISRWGIVGWNAITNQGIEYRNKKVCRPGPLNLPACEDVLAHSASTTPLGDGTVVVPSAAYSSGTLVSLDLETASAKDKKSISHANILESRTTQSLIRKMVTDDSRTGSFDLPTGANWGLPDSDGGLDALVVSTHSPVELHVYDSQGRHTGLIPVPVEGIEEGLVSFTESEIPGSRFDVYGNEDDPETYIHLPDGKGETYSVVVKGTDIGIATLQIERITDGAHRELIETILPVTSLMIASTTVMNSGAEGRLIPLASSTSKIQIDTDGNGSVDAVIDQGSAYDPILNIELMRTLIVSLLGDVSRVRQLDRKLVRLQELIQKGEIPKLRTSALKIEKNVGHSNFKDLTEQDKERIIAMIEAMMIQIE
jgi:pimeloyl-ACP methyl ester carboxylesterase